MGLQTSEPSPLQGARVHGHDTLLVEGLQAALDDEFMTYIKDMKSQSDENGQVRYMSEELMTMAENRYNHLMSKVNTARPQMNKTNSGHEDRGQFAQAQSMNCFVRHECKTCHKSIQRKAQESQNETGQK